MNYQIRTKTKYIESLLNIQKGVQEFTEFVEMGEDAYKYYAAEEEKPAIVEAIERDKKTLRAFKISFNNHLENIKPYEVENV
jgi:hypothetical protein